MNLGKIAYEAFHKNKQGYISIPYSQVPLKLQDAWEAAATAASNEAKHIDGRIRVEEQGA